MSSGTTVRIARLETTYVVPRGHPAVHDLKARGEEVVRDRLRGALDEVFARMLPRDSPAVWIIRELTVDFAFAAERNDSSLLAATWAHEIAQSLTRTLMRGEGVLRFASRAAFLAQFVADVAAGRETDRWYYADFASLGALPVSAKIREAIVRESDRAADVVLELARSHRLEQVLASLSDRSAAEIYDVAFPVNEVASPSARLVESVLAFADRLTRRADDGSLDTPHNRMRVLIAMLEQYGDRVAAADLRVHVDNLLRFSGTLARVEDRWRLPEALIDQDERVAAELCGRNGWTDLDALRWLTALAGARPDLITCAAGTLAPATSVTRRDLAPSSFAGLALLLPDLDELTAFSGRSIADAAARVLIAIKCAGDARVREVLGDPVLMLFSGREHHIGEEDIRSLKPADLPATLASESASDDARHYLQVSIPDLDAQVDEVTTLAANAVMMRFAQRLFGFAGSSLPYVNTNFLAGNGALDGSPGPIVIDLPAMPLEVVLRMAGFHERTFALSWLDMPVTLRLGAVA